MKPLKLLLILFVAIAALVKFSLFAGEISGLPQPQANIVSIVMFSLLLLTAIAPLKDKGLAFTAIKIDELVADLGAYCQDHREILTTESLQGEDFDQRFEVMDDITDELPMPSLSITDLIRPGNSESFDPTSNALAFGAQILKVRHIKVDLLLNPTVMEKTWLGKQKKSSDPFDIPFEAFIMNYISQKIKENLILKAIYKGVYNAAGTTPGATMDGYLKLIGNGITATDIAPVVTGAITATNVVTALEAVYDGLGEAYKGGATEIKVAPQIFDWYGRKFRSEFGANQDYKGITMNRRQLDGTNSVIVREPGLAGSQRIIATPFENMVYGIDSASFNMDIQKFNRTIKILIDFKGGVIFKETHSRALSVNDQA